MNSKFDEVYLRAKTGPCSYTVHAIQITPYIGCDGAVELKLLRDVYNVVKWALLDKRVVTLDSRVERLFTVFVYLVNEPRRFLLDVTVNNVGDSYIGFGISLRCERDRIKDEELERHVATTLGLAERMLNQALEIVK